MNLSSRVFALCLVLWPSVMCGQNAKRPLTVADSIEATQVLEASGREPVLISPDGRRYIVILEHGDISRNATCVELLSGSTESLEAASRAHIVARLLSKSTAAERDLVGTLRWLSDSEHVAFLWDDGDNLPQVDEVDVRTHKIRRLTHHLTPVIQYDISRNGRTMIFVAQTPRIFSRSRVLGRKGFVVKQQSIWSLLGGDFEGWTPRLHYETFVSSLFTEGQPGTVSEPDRQWAMPPELLTLSPDGRYAIAVRPVGEVPKDWDKYTEHMFKEVYLPPARRHPHEPNWVRQYVIVDTVKASSWPLWDAPENPLGRVVWAPDGRSLIVGPTFLPAAQADAAGLSGSAVAELDVRTGRFVRVPVPVEGTGAGYVPVRWNNDGVIELTNASSAARDGVRLKYKKAGGAWHLIAKESHDAWNATTVRIELRQGLNTPPSLYAIDASGRDQLIRDVDPQLRSDVTLGHVEVVHWKALDGKAWSGLLYFPVHYEIGQGYPLVIQTHGYSPDAFSLDGAFTTAFAAQPLANCDIAVLQVGGPDIGDYDITATPQEPQVYMAGFEGAIRHFVGSGLADRKKVGIIGFSRTGWLVEYMLTHSDFPFAAAEVADNIDGSYLQYVLGDAAFKSSFESDKAAAPFGSGLETWFREAPGFNAEKVRAPLRLEVDSGPIDQILEQWEMFSDLQYLCKPVELSVIPDIQHGVHVLQNPAQRLASQGGTVDWFRFWLKSEDDPDPAKAEQYARWRELRRLQGDNYEDTTTVP
jgi:dipeptidyl aminopeptidase/acylaminoacyl peptidase